MHKQQKIKKSKKYRFLPKKNYQKNKKKIRKVFNKISSSFLRSLTTISDQRTEKIPSISAWGKIQYLEFFRPKPAFCPPTEYAAREVESAQNKHNSARMCQNRGPGSPAWRFPKGECQGEG